VKDKNSKQITSVGIDVGTTTTQMVVSKLTICNTAPGSAVPRMTITGKEVIYRSGIHFTPLASRDLIDTQAVTEIISREYHQAGITPDQVDTGAVIITGETARKENARGLLNDLSGFAGNFVVATAGPLLESIIAGRGAGAAALSSELHRNVLNIDVGGGTSNLAVFEEGRPVDTTCINIGGRLVEVEPGGERVAYITPAGRVVLEESGMELDTGDMISLDQVRAVTRVMAGAIKSLLSSRPLPQVSRRLMMGPPLRLDYPIHIVTFSGGVSDFVYSGGEIWNVREGSRYGDIGPFLGEALREAFSGDSPQLVKPRETIRATVIGAGAHTLNLSGSTIKVSRDILPLRNVPVVNPFPGTIPQLPGDLAGGLAKQMRPYWLGGYKEPVAIALRGMDGAGFKKLQGIAAAVAAATRDYVKSGQPLVLILEDDCAKVMGQMLAAILGDKAGIICLDQLHVADGDYIDIGEPIMEDTVVPVIIKTIVFEGH
jgi:ethanolamine utilization protein EutA